MKRPASGRLTPFLLAAALSCALGHAAFPRRAAAAELTYPDLIKRLTDLEALAVLPEAGERASQWTSRDRASRYDSGTDRYLAWDANADGGGFIGDNGDGGRIMAEMNGPGCIWRIWTARANEGRVRIFLDGSATPAVDLPFRAYFDRTEAPFTYASLVYNAAGGLNNYVPIPYGKSAKVVAYGDWGLYYHIGHTAFSAGTVVPTFSRNLAIASRNALEAADAALKPEALAAFRPTGSATTVTLTVPPGGTSVVLDRPGAGAVTGLEFRIAGLDQRPRGEQWTALRELTVSMTWDGAAEPAVWAPLGDFFAAACGPHPHQALPVGLTADGWFQSRWVMPFADGARITLGNDGAVSRTITAEVTVAQPSRDPATLGRFHAKWNRNALQPQRADRRPDYTVLRASGRGRFLGFMLHLYKANDAVEPGSNPGEYWWGEGDEKFFVDGEKEPSWFGTGTEDYFGYAWATPDYFSKAYHHQLYNEGGIHMQGNRVLARFQVQDNVPFQSSIEAAVEKYYRNDSNVAYAVMPYWYQQAGTADAYGPVPLSGRLGWFAVPGPRDTARLEGEDFDRRSATAGSLVVQRMQAFAGTWSAGGHLLWFKNNLSEVGPGAVATWTFDAPTAGRAGVHGVFTRAPDFGTFQFRIDGRPCGGAVDLYGSQVAPMAEMKLCEVDLTAGPHEMSATVSGKNAASNGHCLGLDYLRLSGLPLVSIDSALPKRTSGARARFGFDARGVAREPRAKTPVRVFTPTARP